MAEKLTVTTAADAIRHGLGEAHWRPEKIEEVVSVLLNALLAAQFPHSYGDDGDGWQMVPVEPTEAMYEAADHAFYAITPNTARHIYSFMLAAAPSHLPANIAVRKALEPFARAAKGMDEFDRRVGNKRVDDETANAFRHVPDDHQPIVGDLRRAREALEGASGWAEEPTDEMKLAGAAVLRMTTLSSREYAASQTFKAMLAVTPYMDENERLRHRLNDARALLETIAEGLAASDFKESDRDILGIMAEVKARELTAEPA